MSRIASLASGAVARVQLEVEKHRAAIRNECENAEALLTRMAKDTLAEIVAHDQEPHQAWMVHATSSSDSSEITNPEPRRPEP